MDSALRPPPKLCLVKRGEKSEHDGKLETLAVEAAAEYQVLSMSASGAQCHSAVSFAASGEGDASNSFNKRIVTNGDSVPLLRPPYRAPSSLLHCKLCELDIDSTHINICHKRGRRTRTNE